MDMKRLMAQMETHFASAQKKMAVVEVIGESGGENGVQVKMSGTFEIKDIKINFPAKDSEDIEILQDLLLSAIKQAHAKVEQELKKLTAGAR
jgi:DNA-binding YbaB/EbfC family protein